MKEQAEHTLARRLRGLDSGCTRHRWGATRKFNDAEALQASPHPGHSLAPLSTTLDCRAPCWTRNTFATTTATFDSANVNNF